MSRWVHAFVAIAGVCAALTGAAAHAAAPMQKTQGPGYYRMMLGDFEITALSDGTIDLDMQKMLTDTTPERVAAALARQYLTPMVETSVSAYLVNTGPKLVLIDAGSGTMFGPTLGKLAANLRAAGYDPAQVDEILVTHLHGDHAGGLVTGEVAVFPNAIVRAAQKEADHWLSPTAMEAAPEAVRPAYRSAMASIKPYSATGRFKPFSGDAELVPGIRAIVTGGHTPGHAIFAVESRGQKIVFWGDLMHVGAVQFAEPSVTFRFDTDPKTAASQRKKNFADAAQRGYWVGAAHLPFPGIGRVRSDGEGSYLWIPANYTALNPAPKQ
jgi:glyoxylase-like metal-dependent hydrolase (beta-lactamase superfamily II)